MSDLQAYVKNRKESDADFAQDYDCGYEEFKIGLLIKELRIKEGLTQEQLAQLIHTKKSVISRIENHAVDIRLSTLSKVAGAFGKKLQIALE